MGSGVTLNGASVVCVVWIKSVARRRCGVDGRAPGWAGARRVEESPGMRQTPRRTSQIEADFDGDLDNSFELRFEFREELGMLGAAPHRDS